MKEKKEQGQVLAWVVVLLPLLLALVGLVFDGGLLWVQFRKAQWAVDSAAVAAASDIDRQLFGEHGQVVLTENAMNTAVYYAAQNYAGLHVDSVYVLHNTIYVRGWFQTRPAFLGLFGVSGFRVHVLGKERPAWGISHAGE